MSQPLIVLVDDRANDYGDVMAKTLEDGGKQRVLLRHPSELLIDDLTDASLVLVDFKLEFWDSRDQLGEIALKPQDGIGLIAVLRRHIPYSLTAFALISSSIQDAFGGVSERNHRHQLARVESLEWVFEKTDPRLEIQVSDLTRSIAELRAAGRVRGMSLRTLLKVPTASAGVLEVAINDVRRCIPPIGDLESLTSGLSFIRWLSQRVLPYPTFVVDKFHLAARLGIATHSLDQILAAKTEIAKRIDELKYRGLLGRFMGDRWWKSGLDELAWEISEQGALDQISVVEKMAEMTGLKLTPIEPKDPVVLVDEDLLPTGQFAERGVCVRLLPDDWPAYADGAYCEILTVVQSPILRAMVHPDDVWLLPEEPQNGA